MFQNLCLSLLALVTYLRCEIMEDQGIAPDTIELFWNLQDFEKGRVRMIKLLLLVVHKCFICPNWAFLCICWWFMCLRFKLLFRSRADRRSNQRYFVSNLGTLPQSYFFLLFCILNMRLLIHKNPCDAWFDCCSLVCLSALALQLRQLFSGASASGAGFAVTYVQFLNIYQGTYICEHVSLTLFDQTCNVS